jgi:glutamine cyclotransferase
MAPRFSADATKVTLMRSLVRLGEALLLAALLRALTGCGRPDPSGSNLASAQARPNLSGEEQGTSPKAGHGQATVLSYEVINVWPHDRAAFTEGLVFLKGALWESTGLNGQSSLRKVDLQTGKVLKQADLPAEYFAEGLAALHGKLYQLTWKARKGFVYDLESFRLEREFTYEGEGWGLTTDGQNLIMSDGTERIRFMDPASFAVKKTIRVFHQGEPVQRLNELEYVEGEILANVWGTEYVVRIDPATGNVTGIINFIGLLPAEDRPGTDVLNGIAYDAEAHRLFVTGKLWPKLFEVRLK